MEGAVARFGGIDILVNNASAISLTGTLETPVRRFDLMMSVNARGTFVCSQACIPHLKKSANPHILVLAPPPDIRAKWFAPHGAYSLAKYGMSLLALGMAEEFRKDGIAVNCLWPRTLIATAALGVIDAGPPSEARKPEIVADAAHAILVANSRSTTGNFFIDEEVLRTAMAFGSERTMEQDPTFAFRIVIDIALKALSPAINDPTTAVLAIDQLHRMLRSVGRRNLRTDEILDASGRLRVIFRTPNWDDFVHLAFSEIRACGANNLQIMRRLRAMIENLKETLPSHRQDELQHQVSLLDCEAKRLFRYPEELALAMVADSQGLGGHSSKITRPSKSI